MSEATPNPPAETPKPAPAPAAPAKPAAKPGEERRSFLLSAMGIAWSSLIAAAGCLTLGTLRFLVPNTAELPGKFKAGFPDDYEEGQVVTRFKDQNTWVVRHEGILYALSTTCTHLGCTPNWLEREQKFKCPCHGSGFYITGINFEGPAPRPLERWGIKIGDDGQIVVDRSMKFQWERGEWTSPDSFIKV